MNIRKQFNNLKAGAKKVLIGLMVLSLLSTASGIGTVFSYATEDDKGTEYLTDVRDKTDENVPDENPGGGGDLDPDDEEGGDESLNPDDEKEGGESTDPDEKKEGGESTDPDEKKEIMDNYRDKLR